MSLCISFFTNGKAIICADSRVSSHVNGKGYYVGDNFQKIRQFGNNVIFMSGTVNIVEAAFNLIYVDDSLDDIAQKAQQLYETYPKADNPELGIYVFITGKGWPTFYEMNHGDNFIIHTVKTDKTVSYAIGAYSDEVMKWLIKNSKGGEVEPLIRSAFDQFSNEEIGGRLTWFLLDENGVLDTLTEVLPDKGPLLHWPGKTTKYHATMGGKLTATDATIKGTIFSSAIEGSVITGSTIQTKQSGQYPRAEMNSSDQMFKVNSSSSNSIEIRAIGDPTSIPDLQFKTGSAKAAISLPSAMTGLYMNGERLTAEFMEIKLRGYNGVSVTGWDRLRSEDSGSSLQAELDNTAYNMTFDSSTRNLKLWSRSGQLLAQVNIS